MGKENLTMFLWKKWISTSILILYKNKKKTNTDPTIKHKNQNNKSSRIEHGISWWSCCHRLACGRMKGNLNYCLLLVLVWKCTTSLQRSWTISYKVKHTFILRPRIFTLKHLTQMSKKKPTNIFYKNVHGTLSLNN